MLMSPSTSTPAMVSPGFSACSHPGAGLALCNVLPEAPPCTAVMPSCWNIGPKSRSALSVEAGKHQRRFDGHHHGWIGGRVPWAPAATASASIWLGMETWPSPGGTPCSAEASLSGVRASSGRDLSKSLISSISSMGVMPQMASGRKRAHAQRHRAHQFAVDVDRAAAHAAGHVGADRLAQHLGHDNVLVGSPHVFRGGRRFQWAWVPARCLGKPSRRCPSCPALPRSGA